MLHGADLFEENQNKVRLYNLFKFLGHKDVVHRGLSVHTKLLFVHRICVFQKIYNTVGIRSTALLLPETSS